MSRYGGKTYSRRPDCKSSVQFDQLLSENKNKPSTAKVSVAGVHRWGMATFTSIRKNQQQNGRSKDGSVSTALPENDDCNKRIKLSLKPDCDPFSFDSEKDTLLKKPVYVPSSSSSVSAGAGCAVVQPLNTQIPRPNKFFKSSGLRPLAQQNATRMKKNVPSSAAPKKLSSYSMSRADSTDVLLDGLTVKASETSHIVRCETKDLFDALLGDVSNSSTGNTVAQVPTISEKLKLNEQLSCLSVGSSHSSDFKAYDSEVILEVDNGDKMNVLRRDPEEDSFFLNAKPQQKKVVDNNNMFSVENLLKNNTVSFGASKPVEDERLFRTYSQNNYSTKSIDSHFESSNSPLVVSNAVATDGAPNEHSSSQLSMTDLPLSQLLPVAISSSQLASTDLPSFQLSATDLPLFQLSATDQQSSHLSALDLPSSQISTSDLPLSQLSDTDLPLSQLSVPDLPSSQLSMTDTPSFQRPVIFSDLQETTRSNEGFVTTDLSQEIKETLNEEPASKSSYTKSLFKSRKIFNSPKKMKAVYKVRAWHEEDKEESDLASQESDTKSLADEFEEETDEPLTVGKLVLSKKISKANSMGESVTSWRCDREVKQLYTVVHNVKQAHQCHESGETQEFNDDVEYLLEGIQLKSSLGTRCLSTLGWASKCMTPSFRIHLRAHGTIPRVFSALMDAPANPSLSLCTATLMFVLSQDRLTMDLEASTLSLMLQLLECKVGEAGMQPRDLPMSALQIISPHQAEKVKEKVRSLCEQMQQKGYAKQLDLNNITGGILAMETLLSLSARRTGEWFKEEIRTLGGLDYIVDTVKTDVDDWCNQVIVERVAGVVLEKLRKIDRCLRVIEKVTYLDQENQTHLLNCRDNILVTSCIELLEKCRSSIAFHPIEPEEEMKSRKKNDTPGSVLFACLLTLLKVLFNLTHDNALGSSNVGSQEGFIDCILLLLMETPIYIPLDERFDLLVMALSLLINMVEHCESNREKLVLSKTVGCYDSENSGVDLSGVEALVEVFLNRLELAKQSEEQADALLDSQSQEPEGNPGEEGEAVSASQASSQQSQVEQMEETLMKALQKAGKHMEHSIIAAYIALILGCIIQNSDYSNMIRDYMPEGNFQSMIEILKKFVNFANLTGMSSTSGMKSVERVLAILESS